MRRKVLIAAVALVALVLAVAVVSAAKKRSTTAAAARSASPLSAAASTPASGGGQVGSSVLRLVATDIDGRSVSVPSGGKPGALWFFAGWCGECLPVGHTLGQVQQQLGSRVNITAISPDPSDSVSALRSFRSQDGNPAFPFVWNSTGSLGQQYNVRALDTTLVYDARGKVVYRGVSPDLAALHAAFRAAGVT